MLRTRSMLSAQTMPPVSPRGAARPTASTGGARMSPVGLRHLLSGHCSMAPTPLLLHSKRQLQALALLPTTARIKARGLKTNAPSAGKMCGCSSRACTSVVTEPVFAFAMTQEKTRFPVDLNALFLAYKLAYTLLSPCNHLNKSSHSTEDQLQPSLLRPKLLH